MASGVKKVTSVINKHVASSLRIFCSRFEEDCMYHSALNPDCWLAGVRLAVGRVMQQTLAAFDGHIPGNPTPADFRKKVTKAIVNHNNAWANKPETFSTAWRTQWAADAAAHQKEFGEYMDNTNPFKYPKKYKHLYQLATEGVTAAATAVQTGGKGEAPPANEGAGRGVSGAAGPEALLALDSDDLAEAMEATPAQQVMPLPSGRGLKKRAPDGQTGGTKNKPRKGSGGKH